MSSTRSDNLAPEAAVDTTPFLCTSLYSRSLAQSSALASGSASGSSAIQSVRTQGLRQAARFFRRASSSRRIMREPSMMVREVAAQQIEDRQSDWAYSRPVVLLDVAWNLSFVVVATVVLVLSWDEEPALPLRLWIVGYALQCFAHMLCVSAEYRRRRQRWRTAEGDEGELGEESELVDREQDEEEPSLVARHLESANTMFSFVWWVIGFYWICVGGQALQLNSPELYWLCVVFLAFDVFFVIFCVALASVIAVAVCCCLPCIIAVLYVLADRSGASKEDIELLPKYIFQRTGGETKDEGDILAPSEGIMIECGTNNPTQHKLSAENAECCICLSAYEDGTELRELPCGHHFHCSCVDKWLYINSTCPLCKYDILKRSIGDDGEV
ncbi:hypothetical protein V2J09_014692 [Rumex salicifolius]